MIRITSMLMMMIFALPSAIGLYHAGQDHDHIDHCENASTTHFHKKQLDCDLCDVTIDHMTSYAFAKAELYILPLSIVHPIQKTIAFTHYQTPTTYLRGPPLSKLS